MTMRSGKLQPDNPAHILVVEDDAALRETIAYNLRREGYQVVTARTASPRCRSRDSSRPRWCCST